MPTRKLTSAAIAAAVIAVLRLVINVDADLEQAVNVIVPLITAYFVANDSTPRGDGVPS